MRIAVSGTHFMGKTTLIEDFIGQHPHYKHEIEPYYQLDEEESMEMALEPSLDTLLKQLDYSMNQLKERALEANIIFDKCPVDFVAYAMCSLDKDSMDIEESEVFDRFPDIKEALDHLDLILFLPMGPENSIVYTEENPAYRRAVDGVLKKIYRNDIYDIFPSYHHPKIVELSGDRRVRLKKLDTILKT